MKGHSTAEADDDVKPGDVLNQMLNAIKQKFGEKLKGNLLASQFNNVT